MTILSLLNFVGIWIPAVMSALYAGLMKQLNPEYIVTMNTYISGLRIGFFVMLLNLLVNVVTFSNGKRKYGPFDALEFERDPYSHPTKKLSATYPTIPEEMATKQPSGIVIGKRGKRYVCNQLSESGAHHTIILGESGCGKTSTVVLDTLLCNAETAIFAIDVKGELHQKGACLGDANVMIVDPEDRGTYGYDLFYALRENPSEQEVLDTLRDTVLSLIPLRADEKNPFWPRSARSLLLALMLYSYHRGIRNVIDIADEITKDSIRSMVEEVFNESAEDSTEHKLISTFYSLPDETLGSVNGQIFNFLIPAALPSRILWALEWIVLIILYARMFSKNINKRYQENEAFLRRQFYVSEWWKKWKFRFQESRKYHIYRCPNCKQKVRVPRGRGRISIHCPKCGTDFIKKS